MSTPLHEPLITERDIEVVSEALRSQWVSTGGPYISKFERQIAEFTGFTHSISVANGTIGLVLAIEILKRRKNIHSSFHVLVPTLSFAATWNSVFAAGGVPVPVDTEIGEVNISGRTLKASIDQKFSWNHDQLIHKETKLPVLCALPAHILGWASHLDEIKECCKTYRIGLIEDAAESLGSFYKNGKHVGHHGDFSVISFNGNKILTTGGGGMVMTNDDSLAQKARHLSTTAKTDNLRFVHDEPGFNYRMVNVLAALGFSQATRLVENLSRKKEIADLYFRKLEGSGIEVYSQNNCVPNNWINTVKFKSLALRESAFQRLQANGIDSRPLWTPFHQLSYCPKDNNVKDFPNATLMWKTMLSLPSSPQLNDDEILKICELLKAT